MKIFNKEYIELNLEVSSKKDALKKISLFAKNLKITDNEKNLYNAFLKREEESSTGFEKGFAIPHARDMCVKKSALFFVRFKNPIDWDSIDKQKTHSCFVIMIPKENEGKDHLETLSKVSIALMNDDFIDNLNKSKSKPTIFEMIDKYIQQNEKLESNDKQAIENKSNIRNIIAITACPVGVAHTYLAAEKLNTTAKENNWNIKVETHGSSGIKNKFSDEEIKNADIVIIASDIGIDLSRFENKKVYQTNVKQAIHNPKELIDQAYEKAIIYKSNNKDSEKNKNFSDSNQKTSVMKHILSGISYMVPFVIFGGICIALSLGIGKIIYGDGSSPPDGDFLYYLNQAGSVAFSLMIGALGAYIANSIAGRAAIAPAFIVSVLGNTPAAIYSFGGIDVQTAMGFLGSIIFGLSIGYTVKWINSWTIPKSISSIMPIFVIPLGVGIFYSLISIFVIGAPVAFVMNKFTEALKSVFVSDGKNTNVTLGVSIAIGILLGAMAGFDMGGPINKVAFLTCSTLITQNVYEPMGMMAAAIPCAPLGMGLCSMIFRQKFNEQEKSLGVSAFIMGLIGISEGAIPFAISDPKKAIPCNMIGSAVAGGVAGALGVTDAAAHGGPIVGVLGAVSSSSYGLAAGIGFFFLAIIIGTLVTCFLYGFLRRQNTNKENNLISNNKKYNAINFFIKKGNFSLKKLFSFNKQGNRKPSHKNNFSSLVSKSKISKNSIIFYSMITFLIIFIALAISLLVTGSHDYSLFITATLKGDTNKPDIAKFIYGIFFTVMSIIFIIASILFGNSTFNKKLISKQELI